MSRLLVRRGAQVRALEFTGTPLVSEVLQGANLAPAQPCGGRGTCGKCAVRLSGAVSAPRISLCVHSVSIAQFCLKVQGTAGLSLVDSATFSLSCPPRKNRCQKF